MMTREIVWARRTLLALALTAALAACSSAGGLPAALSQRMDAKGAVLDRAQALAMVNQYRSSTGVPALTEDPTLDASADALALTYSKTGTQQPKPAGALQVRYSAGYYNFAETFSGWRNSPADSAVLTSASATRAGLAARYDPNSNYGVYWVLVLG
jgi:uncharacterized protein YkwD